MPEESERSTDWSLVVRQNPTGHAEWQNPVGGMVFNGPVELMWIDDSGYVHILLRWIARMPYIGNPGYGTWTNVQSEIRELSFPGSSIPFEVQDMGQKGYRVWAGKICLIIYLEDRGLGIKAEQVVGLRVPLAG